MRFFQFLATLQNSSETIHLTITWHHKLIPFNYIVMHSYNPQTHLQTHIAKFSCGQIRICTPNFHRTKVRWNTIGKKFQCSPRDSRVTRDHSSSHSWRFQLLSSISVALKNFSFKLSWETAAIFYYQPYYRLLYQKPKETHIQQKWHPSRKNVEWLTLCR